MPEYLLDSLEIEAWLALWDETKGGDATFINLSENHTFRITGPSRSQHILRLHRPGYQTLATIESELAWLSALAGTGLPVPRAIAGHDGEFVQRAGERYAVLFSFEEGREPNGDEDMTMLFRTIGSFAATAHRHVETWTPPRGFRRPSWTAEAILDPGGLWDDWRKAPHVEGAVRATLDELDRRLREALVVYGTTRERFGLIHADMRLANLLVAGPKVTLIDFDDCGFGWFMYDFAASLSFIETTPQAAALRQSWIEGYTSVRALSSEDLRIIDAMILLRRMALLAWIGSHSETELAAQHRDRFARDTADLAEVWMAQTSAERRCDSSGVAL